MLLEYNADKAFTAWEEMKTAKRAWLFFALCCIFLMGSSLFRTGALELKMASAFSPFLKTAQVAKSRFHYVLTALISPDKFDSVFRENGELRLQSALRDTKKREDVQHFLIHGRAPSFCKILLRPLERWSSSMWIERPVISSFQVEEDCPVVAGGQLLGLVEKIDKNACSVRLLGDPLMKVAVMLSEELSLGDGVSSQKLKTLRGDVAGIAPPYWGESANLVKGQLFLHPQDRLHLKHPLPIEEIAKGLINADLVTSGLDGAFPPGLVVGKIAKVIPPLEGECVFQFEAMPLPIWDDLTEVTLLERRLLADL